MVLREMRSYSPAMISDSITVAVFDGAATDHGRVVSEVFLTGRTAGASVTAFLMTLLFGPFAIRWLRLRFRERIASDSQTLNELHADKADTPTMGGVFLMAAVVLSSVIWGDLRNTLVLTALSVVVSLTVLGAVDDWIKQRTERKGLGARQKLVVQIVISCGAALALRDYLAQQSLGHQLFVFGTQHDFAWSPLFLLWAVLVLVGSSNAVNLTDGLDGLATGCTVPAGAAFAILTYLSGNRLLSEHLHMPHVIGCGELTIVLGALVGAMLGFLWFNCHPAQVFMGDAGSLPIGGLLAVGALACRQEILLTVIGGVFVVETLSVIIQVTGYRLVGRRLLRCSPLHNHFVFRGDSETQIVVRFWIFAVILAIAGLATLNLR